MLLQMLGGKSFNPRPPRGGRQDKVELPLAVSRFQSTPPARGATSPVGNPLSMRWFQSTPPARGATHRPARARGRRRVSIHAPRAGGDGSTSASWPRSTCFNPRPPRGGRLWFCGVEQSGKTFQSTPPARGATTGPPRLPPACCSFNPRPPRGGRRRPPRRNRDRHRFQSTPPARGATLHRCVPGRQDFVSIHAPRAGGDWAYL